MKIYVDADSCPVTHSIKAIATTEQIETFIIRSFAHFSQDEDQPYITFLYVDPENEAVDYKIFALVSKNDVVITQDYGLASLVLEKGAYVVHPKGFQYTEQNMNQLLDTRYISLMKRKSGERTKGPSKFTIDDQQRFEATLKTITNSR